MSKVKNSKISKWVEPIRNYFLQTSKQDFSKFDFAVLQMMMMLAASDGKITDSEIACFREAAEVCRGYNERSFRRLWKSALKVSGYLMMQSRFLSADEFVLEFVNEAEVCFIKELATEPKPYRKKAFEYLRQLAASDGDFSEIEQHCLDALLVRVNEAWNLEMAKRYSRAAMYSSGDRAI